MPFDAAVSTITNVDRLTYLRSLIDAPEKWIKYNFEEDQMFCLVGAANKTIADLGGDRDELVKILNRGVPITRHRHLCPRANVTHYNDKCSTSHRDVLAVVDRAIFRQNHAFLG